MKQVVNEPTLCKPTEKQTFATERSVVRSNAAARSRRRVKRYACGDSPKARRNSRLKCARDRPAARARSSTVSGSKYWRVRDILGPEQVAGGRDEGHVASIPRANEVPGRARFRVRRRGYAQPGFARLQEMDPGGAPTRSSAQANGCDGSTTPCEEAGSAAPPTRGQRRIGRGERASRRAARDRRPPWRSRSWTTCFAKALVSIECTGPPRDGCCRGIPKTNDDAPA